MKIFSLPTLIVAAAATALLARQDRRAVPKTEARTVVTAKHSPATVTGVEVRGDRYFLSGKDGPIAVDRNLTLWEAIDQVRLKGHDLPQDPFAIGLVEDPDNPSRRLVVAWKPQQSSVGQP